MDAELKAKWVADLRSRKFRQGIWNLCSRDKSFCCLGVLCLSAGGEFKEYEGFHDDIWVTLDGVPVLDGALLSAGEDGELNEEFLKKIGLTNEQQGILIFMNDDSGQSFTAIADWIEKNL